MKRTGIISGSLAAILAFGFFLYFKNDFNKDRCHEVRAGFDIGSGSTKILVAETDVCTKKVVKILLDRTEKVEFQEDLNRSNDKTLSKTVIDHGLMVLRQMKSDALALGTKSFRGYATAAFRTAGNGLDVVSFYSQRLNLNLRVVSQDEEGIIGLRGVSALIDKSPSEIVVWDIGGGTQEIVANAQGASTIYKGVVASVGFKDLVIQQIKQQNPDKVKSPNPMTQTEVQSAILAARKLARSVDRGIRETLLQPTTEVIGIGGVHWYSVRGRTGAKDTFTQEDIRTALAKYVGKSDFDLNSNYAETEVTNLALVLGYMEELGVSAVHPMKVNLAVGAIIE